MKLNVAVTSGYLISGGWRANDVMLYLIIDAKVHIHDLNTVLV